MYVIERCSFIGFKFICWWFTECCSTTYFPRKLNRTFNTVNCDSDGFASECSDISTTTTSGSSVQSYIMSTISNEISSKILNVENQKQSISNRPKIVSLSSVLVHKVNGNSMFGYSMEILSKREKLIVCTPKNSIQLNWIKVEEDGQKGGRGNLNYWTWHPKLQSQVTICI